MGFMRACDGIAAGPRTPRTFSDHNLWFLDLSVGRWIYQNPRARYVTAVAPLVEVHYSTTLQDPEVYQGAAGTITDFSVRRDVLNMTGGIHFRLGQYSDLTVGAVAPMRTSGNRQFDAELAVEFNRRF